MSGEAEFGEEFFDNMRVPDKNRMSEVNRGWYVAMTALQAERSGGGAFWGGGGLAMAGLAMGGQRGLLGTAQSIAELAKKTKRYGKAVWEDPAFRQRIAQLAIEGESMRFSGARMVAKMRKGVMPTNEASLVKNFQAEMRKRMGDLVMEIIGAYSQLTEGSPHAIDDGQWVYAMLRARGATIEMGTSEINRNIIAERILGLPR
jgi:alkylation response protein AidB-like acyl-CoA dehydrogenase